MSEYQLIPITLKQSYEFCEQHHRHNKGTRGHKFSIGLKRGEQLVGVVVVGRPIARINDDDYTAQVLRTCVLDDCMNANSMLYGAACRACKAMGYKRVITYTLECESGTSLKAAGFVRDRSVQIHKSGWDTKKRRRETLQVSMFPKQRWHRDL